MRSSLVASSTWITFWSVSQDGVQMMDGDDTAGIDEPQVEQREQLVVFESVSSARKSLDVADRVSQRASGFSPERLLPGDGRVGDQDQALFVEGRAGIDR